MKFSVIERDDGINHVVLEGHFDSTATEEIRGQLAGATSECDQNAIVELSGVDFLSSRGIGLLFFNGKLMKSAGRQMVLLNPQEIVESVLKTSRVEHLIPILHDLDEAVVLLGGSSPTAQVACDANLQDAPADATAPHSSRDTSKTESLEVSIKNDLSKLPELTGSLDQFMNAHGVPQRAAYAIKLAIDELVVNVISYAYVDDDSHSITVNLMLAGEQLILNIADDGRPFDPRTGPALDLHAEDREPGGLGLLLVLDMVDVLNYRREDEKNLVEIRVHLLAETSLENPSSGEQNHVESTD